MCSSIITSSIGKHERNESGGDSRHDISNDSLDTILIDPRTKMRLLQKMGLEDRGDRTSPSKGLENVLCVSHANLTPSGMSAGGWPRVLPWLPGDQSKPDSARILATMAASQYSLALRRCNAHRPKQVSVELMGVEIPIQLLNEAEALELIEFDPGVNSKDAWDPPKPMTSFLEKHFNRSLSDAEREAIMKDS